MKKPELLAPTLARPEALPVPEFKKPDDGTVVEFPKPGAGGMSMTGMATGPMPPVPSMAIAVLGPPIVVSMSGREMAMFPIVMGPTLRACVVPVPRTSMSAVYLGMVMP